MVTCSTPKEAVSYKHANACVLHRGNIYSKYEDCNCKLHPQEVPQEFQYQDHSFKVKGHKVYKHASTCIPVMSNVHIVQPVLPNTCVTYIT